MAHVYMPMHLYAAIAIAQRKPQRISNRVKPLRRMDILVDYATYERLCKIHQLFLEDSRCNGYHQLTLSEIMRVIIAEAITHDSQGLEL